jgi:signal transduction histidine kinase
MAARTTRVAAACAAGAVLLAAVVLVGWATGVELSLGGVGPFVMLPLTAAGHAAAGAAIWLGRRDASRAAHALGAVVCLLGMLVLLEHATGWSLGIDLLLFPDAVRAVARRGAVPTPGRIALNSGACFVLAGLSLLKLDAETRAGRRTSQWAAGAGLTVVGVALVGYLYGVRPLYTLDRVAGMALSTAVGFALLFLGLLAARGTTGDVGRLVADDLGGVLARRLLPPLTLVPLATGWLWLRGREAGLYGREGGVALFVVVNALTLFIAVLLGTRAVQLVDAGRQRALEREAAARAAAEQASRAKSDFLAVMSHELRTPLNAIVGYTSLLDAGVTGPVTDAQRWQLGRVAASAQHLVGLIDQILSLSRIEAGREAVRVERVAVAALLDDAAAMAAPQAAGKGLAFVVRPPPSAVVVDTDAEKVRQILVNLLSNAVKFTDRGEVQLAAEDRDGVVEFRVRDSGVGIDARHLERIFEPFWQVEQRAAHRAAGTGLGLDVSRRLARLLGGDLSVTSAPGAGSTFTLRVPRAPECTP